MKDHFFCLHVVSLPINYKKNLILIKELEKLVVSAAMFLPPTFFGRSDGYIFRRPFPSIIFPLSIWIAQPTSDNRSPSPLVSPADSGVSPSASSCLSSLASEGRGGGGGMEASPTAVEEHHRGPRVGLVYDERMCRHGTPNGESHPENQQRIKAIWQELESAGVTQRSHSGSNEEEWARFLFLFSARNRKAGNGSVRSLFIFLGARSLELRRWGTSTYRQSTLASTLISSET